MEKPALRLLVVDDGDDYIELCHDFLQRYQYATNCDFNHPCWECERESDCSLKHAHNWDEVEEIMRRHGQKVDVILLDIHFEIPTERLIPSNEREKARGDAKLLKKLQARQGFHILEALRAQYGSIPVVLMTSKNDVALDDPALISQLEKHRFTQMFGDEGVNAQSLAAKIEALGRLRTIEGERTEGRFFWGQAPAMKRLRRWLEVLAEGDQPILISGETGTGKSYLAEHFIHRITGSKAPFCALDLSALPDNLVAAELFGTSRGAFSDAVDRPGRLEFANGGTLFLDEIGNLTKETQKRLLTVVQDRRVTRLGENRARPVDVKLVVATNENLEERVRAGTFRADLFQRLNPAARIEIPPLRDRLDDLPQLLQVITERVFESAGNRRLLHRFAALFSISGRINATTVVGRRRKRGSDGVTFQLAGAAEDCIRRAKWPGNVRQLELVWTNSLTYQLVEQIAAGKVGDEPVIQIDAQLIQDLIRSSSLGEDSEPSQDTAEPEHLLIGISPAKSLNELSRAVESQYFQELYIRSGKNFETMARQLLAGEPTKNARRVQLRFNNLGLSTRKLRKH